MESLMVAVTVSDDETKTRLHAFLEKRAPKVAPGFDSAPKPATPAEKAHE
jgi:hypothetical protein